MCRVLQEALEDPSLHVVLQAIDGLGACPAAIAAETLERLAEPPPASRAGSDSSPEARPWHPAAHALLSLATVAPAGASRLLQRFTAHPVWQLRMYAARAATVLNDGTALDTLARDDHDNVREAAIEGLSRTRGHEADRVYLQAIGRDDYQVIRTAALALKGTKGVDPVTVDTLVAALARLTTARRDTSAIRAWRCWTASRSWAPRPKRVRFAHIYRISIRGWRRARPRSSAPGRTNPTRAHRCR